MSDDLGAVQAGFVNNFAYGTISLTSNTSVELVDQSHNTTSTSPEAVYANELIVPSGATLNLNNLHLYVRGDQISGTIVGGTVTVVPVGRLDRLEYADARDADPRRRGRRLDVLRHGRRIDHGPAQSRRRRLVRRPSRRYSNWGQVDAARSERRRRWRRPAAAASGAIATISGFSLPASGTYTIQVQAPGADSSSTGNYVLSAYNVTPNVSSLTVNQQVHRHDRQRPMASISVTSPAPPASRSSST